MTRLVTPFVPGLEFELRFVPNTAADIQSLSAYIFGPAAQVVRYEKPGEKLRGYLGQYKKTGTIIDGNQNNAYAYPNKVAGAEIDPDFVRLHIDNASLLYADLTGETLEVRGRNEIKVSGMNFISNDADPLWAADAVFGDREVRPGDRVVLNYTNSENQARSFTSYVQALKAVMSEGSVSAAISAVGNASAIPALSVASTGSASSFNVSAADFQISADTYTGLEDGLSGDTYRVEVVQSSDVGDITTGRLRVTTSSGTDDVALVVPAAESLAIGTRGLEVDIVFAPGETVQLVKGDVYTFTLNTKYTLPSLTTSGSYTATDGIARKYLVEVINGGALDESGDAGESAGILLRISEVAGRDTSRTIPLTFSGGDSTNIVLGSYGAVLTFAAVEGLITGDRWTVETKAAAPTKYQTIVLAHSIPDEVTRDEADDIDGILLYMVDDIEVPHRSSVSGQYNFDAKTSELLVRAQLAVTHPDWTVNGVQVPLPVEVIPGVVDSSRMYVTYRAWLPTSPTLQSTSDPASELDSLIDGPTDDANPLKLALSKAGLVSNGNTIYYFNTGNPNVDANWKKALAAADNTRATYGFVPLTRRATVLEAVAGHVTTRSGPLSNLYRVAWLSGDDITEIEVLNNQLTTDGESPLATITDDTETSGQQFTLLELTSGNFSFVAADVRPGDRVRYAFSTDAWGDETYDEYVVERVTGENSLVLASGPAVAETIGRRLEIHRTLTAAERVDLFSETISPFSLPENSNDSVVSVNAKYPGYLIRMMPFGTVYDGAIELPSYYLAAVLATARGALAPHQGMTRMTVPGFTGVKDITLFAQEELNEIAAIGGFIVAPDSATGQMVVRHAVTAGEWNDVNQREESIISTAHSNNFYFYSLLDPYIGKSNAVDETFAKIKNDLLAGRSYLQSANRIEGLGGQLIDMEITKLRKSPLAKDTLLIEMEWDLPGPLNRIKNTVFVVQSL